MRLLTNLETNERKLLQIILIGQPELAAMLERPELQQLAQRIVARYHLGPLSKPEVAAYIRHRLDVAGTQRQLFPPTLMGRVHRLSGGVPRIINVLCDRALLAPTCRARRVDRATLAQAAREVLRTGRQSAAACARSRSGPDSAGGWRLGGGGVSAGAAGDQDRGGQADGCNTRHARADDESCAPAGRGRG
jgi:general secretion pathway protein A